MVAATAAATPSLSLQHDAHLDGRPDPLERREETDERRTAAAQPGARRGWWVAVAATVLTVAIAAAIFLVTAPQRTSEDEVPARAQVWVTSTAEERLEATQSVGASSSAPPGAETGPADDTLTIDLDATGQQVTSFGAALTHSSASLLAAIDDAHRRALLLELFDPSGPVRLSVLRVPFGG